MKTIAVIPAYNEEATVGSVVSQLDELGLRAVVVDDGSSDRTAERAAAAGATVLRHPTNIGVGGALRTGFAYAARTGHERVICVDADLQHEPASIVGLLDAADTTGAELVIGSRFADGAYRVSWSRRLLMRTLGRWISRRVGSELDDVTSGFRVISEPLLSRFAAEYPAEFLGDTVEAILEAHAWGARIVQTDVAMAARPAGEATSRFHAAGHLVRLLLDTISDKLEIEGTSTVFLAALLFLLGLVLHLSVIVSRLEGQVRDITEAHALIEHELREGKG